MVSIGPAFDNLDVVINSLDLGSRDREVKVVKYTGPNRVCRRIDSTAEIVCFLRASR